MDMVVQGNRFVANHTSDTPGKTLIFYNQNNKVISVSQTIKGNLSNVSYPSIYITPDDWVERYTVLHEYGHAVFLLYNDYFPPESSGRHDMGIRYNPQLAFSEAWGHFFAAAVTSNQGIYPDFKLANNPPYTTTEGHHYTPSFKFEGLLDEVMVASFLWEMY
jgi:hypothetical protein